VYYFCIIGKKKSNTVLSRQILASRKAIFGDKTSEFLKKKKRKKRLSFLLKNFSKTVLPYIFSAFLK